MFRGILCQLCQCTMAGAVAVIGPQRMSYKDIVSATEYVAEKSGELISELLEADQEMK